MQLWVDALRRLTEKHFRTALRALPCAAAFRLRAEAEAGILFERLRARELPRAGQAPEQTEDKGNKEEA
jgi:hypothetical protein